MLKFSYKDGGGSPDPPDGYSWTAPDGFKVRNLHRSSWYYAIDKHYRDNGYHQPENWKELAEHQWCLGAPPGWCKHETGEAHEGYFSTRLTAHDYLHGTVVLSQIATHADPLVSPEIASARAQKCAACPANIQVSGCIPCLGIANFIVGIKGSQTTPSDPFLHTCAICKCSVAAKVWVKTEIISEHTGPGEMAAMRAMPDCWAPKDIDNLEQQSINPS